MIRDKLDIIFDDLKEIKQDTKEVSMRLSKLENSFQNLNGRFKGAAIAIGGGATALTLLITFVRFWNVL